MKEGGVSAPVKLLKRRAAFVMAHLLVAGSLPATADVVTLTAVRDNTLFQDAAGSLSSGAGTAIFAGRNNQNLGRRALVRFDVEASIPSGAVISNVVLTLNVSNDWALRSWVLGFGAAVRVIGPSTLADALLDELKRACHVYEPKLDLEPGGGMNAPPPLPI